MTLPFAALSQNSYRNWLLFSMQTIPRRQLETLSSPRSSKFEQFCSTSQTFVNVRLRYITIETEPDIPPPGPDVALVLPRLVARSLAVMKNLQGIQLILWWFSDLQRQELRDRCAGLPVWNSLRLINMENEADTELLAILVSKTRPESFSGLQFWSQTELQAASQCSPFLKRLLVPFRLPASTDVVDHVRFISNRTSLLTQFRRLEWLILTPTPVKPLSLGMIREDPKVCLLLVCFCLSWSKHRLNWSMLCL